MKKKKIQIIIILTTISLFGIVYTQLIWIKNAIHLKEEQFDHRVSIALKGVVSELLENKKDTVNYYHCKPTCDINEKNITGIINNDKIDKLLTEELNNMCIKAHFVYGIYQHNTHKFVMGNYGDKQNEIIKSDHFTSLTCLYKPESFILGVYFPGEKMHFLKTMINWLLISILFVLIVIFCFSYVLVSLLRQKKISEMKTDFVNNMTHEFKTPISTISIASEMLMNPNVMTHHDKIDKYARVIFDENFRLKNQVDQILQISQYEKSEYKLKKKEVDVNEVIANCIEIYDFQIKPRNGSVKFIKEAHNNIIMADKEHLLNVISNLVDNAVKYSPDKIEIIISTKDIKDGIIISVEDKGIGISHEYQKDVFKQFFRVPTGNIHDVKGFGLGLYYVKTIVNAHGGYISLKSEHKKGSKFDIHLPINDKCCKKKNSFFNFKNKNYEQQ